MGETDKPAEVPADPLTIITVKGIEVTTWMRARKGAAANDEMLGPWLNRAINLLADRQEGDGIFPPAAKPDKPVKPVELNPEALQAAYVAAEMVQRILAMPVARAVKAEAQAILDLTLLAAQGLPPRDQRLNLPRVRSPGPADKLRLETAVPEAVDGARRPIPDGSGRARPARAGPRPTGSPAADR